MMNFKKIMTLGFALGLGLVNSVFGMHNSTDAFARLMQTVCVRSDLNPAAPAYAGPATRIGTPVPVAAAQSEPLIDLVKQGGAGIIEKRLRDDPFVDARNYNNETVLIEMARTGYLEAVKTALSNGADIDAKACNGLTALMWASFEGHADVVETLLKHKTSIVNARSQCDETALIMAVRREHLKVVEVLLAYGADAKAADNRGLTALEMAQFKKNEAIEEALRKYGAQ